MIEYSPFWNTLKNSTESTYSLIHKHHVSSAIIDKLRKNKPMNTTTINDLCRILNCQIQDICQYVPSDQDQILQAILNISEKRKKIDELSPIYFNLKSSVSLFVSGLPNFSTREIIFLQSYPFPSEGSVNLPSFANFSRFTTSPYFATDNIIITCPLIYCIIFVLQSLQNSDISMLLGYVKNRVHHFWHTPNP